MKTVSSRKHSESTEGLIRCRNLWAYVLIDAVEAWKEGKTEAHGWLFGASSPQQPGSFAWVCDMLGLDAGWVRELLKLRRRHISFHGLSVSSLCKQ